MTEGDAVFQQIKDTQDEAQASIQQIARDVQLGPEAWIQQAKKLQADIERSKATARTIVKQAQHAETLRARQSEIANKGDLLRSEVAFNVRLQTVLEQFRRLQTELAGAQEATKDGQLPFAFDQLQHLEKGLEDLRTIDKTTASGLLHERVRGLRSTIEEESRYHFRSLLRIDPQQHLLRLYKASLKPSTTNPLDLETATQLCIKLNTLDANATKFSSDLEAAILDSLLSTVEGSDAPFRRRLVSEDDGVFVIEAEDQCKVDDILQGLDGFLSFLKHHLPAPLCDLLSDHLAPNLVHRLLTQVLPSAIVPDIAASADFEALLQVTSSFAEQLTAGGWTGAADLNEWVEAAPRTWISKKRETSLAEVKSILQDRLHESYTAERVETQMISHQELSGDTNGDVDADDWNEHWADDDQEMNDEGSAPNKDFDDDEEVANAWGADDEPPTPRKSQVPSNGSAIHGHADRDLSNAAGDEDEETDAWDWNEEDTSNAPPSPTTTRKPSHAAPPTSRTPKTKPSDQAQEVTLRETYTTTGIPTALHDLITQTYKDADTLRTAPYASSPITPASSALRSVPTLILAGYRALAPTYYQPLPGSNMFLYNDAMRLSETLAPIDTSLTPALESFARRAYGKEMDSQRTILRDLLGLAQGFANCTEQPFAGACDDAISAVVDHISGLQKQWSRILSQSALLQSLGSLLQTVIQKMIVDIEDLSDIGEDESTRLKRYCDDVSKLSSFFTSQKPNAAGESDDTAQNNTTPLYVPNWFKFQHLGEILEGKLADIQYFWTEGDLKLGFEKEELIELIEALFADSPIRKRAIGEIRRG